MVLEELHWHWLCKIASFFPIHLRARAGIVHWALQQCLDILLMLCALCLVGATIKFLVLYMLGMFVPYLYIMYLSWTIFEMFTPIMGRSGSEIPPDVVLAGFIVAITMILSSYFVSRVFK